MSFNLEELYNQGVNSSSLPTERTPFLTIKDPAKKVKLMVLCEFNELKVELIHPRIDKPDGKTGDVRCIGKKMGCPLCLAEQRVQKRAYIPVLDLDDKIVKILPISLGKNYANVQNLAMFFQENGTVKDVVWTFARNGTGLSTTYTFLPGKQQALPAGVEPPDIEGLINRIPESTIMLSSPSKKGSALDDELGFLSAD